jgi:hypothetical protein
MDLTIAALLTQDGVITGAVYALLAMGIVLVFSVTRVIFVPQGDYVAYAALTMAAMQAGKTPGVIWLLLILSAIATVMEYFSEGQNRFTHTQGFTYLSRNTYIARCADRLRGTDAAVDLPASWIDLSFSHMPGAVALQGCLQACC